MKSTRMRIVEVNKFYYPRRGAERHFLDLIDLLRSRGHEVAVFAMDDPRNVSSEYGRYSVSAVGYNDDDSDLWQKIIGIGRLFWSFEGRRKLRWLLDDFHPDIVHIHNAYHQLSLSILPVIRKRGIPIVMTVHDYHLISPDKDEYYGSIGQSYWKFLFVRKYGFGKRTLLVLKSYWEQLLRFPDMIDQFLVPSEYVKRIMTRGGIPEKKITVIPHFVSDPGEPAAAEGDPYALYFGGITEEKNIKELVALFDRLKYPLLLAGRKSMAVPEGRYIRCVGEKNGKEFVRLIAGASCIVSASRLPETFGFVVLEANVLGKPFLGYRTGAFPELVEEGVTGYLSETQEEFERIVQSYVRQELRLGAPDEIRRMTLGRFGKEAYLDVFERVMRDVSKKMSH